MKKKILIIGSTGYIGIRLKKILSKKYNLITPNKIKLDITNYYNLKKFVNNNIHYIINLSGQISSNSKLMKRIIVKGNRNIIRACNRKKIKIFYLSTSLVYGYTKNSKNESSKRKPVDNYSKYKLIAENEYLKSNSNFIILRLCNIYNGKKNGIINNLTSSIIRKKKLFLTNSKAYRNYIYINDLLSIIIKMLNKKLKYKIYNIGFENVKLNELINHLKGKLKVKINYYDRNMSLRKIPSQKISHSRIFKELKYTPKIKIKNYLTKKVYGKY